MSEIVTAEAEQAVLEPRDGKVITCKLAPVHVDHARRHLGASPHADQIEAREGPALTVSRSRSSLVRVARPA
jgi:predicted O-methyltransferase YrrM